MTSTVCFRKCRILDVTGKRREQVPIQMQKGHIVLDLKASQKSVYDWAAR